MLRLILSRKHQPFGSTHPGGFRCGSTRPSIYAYVRYFGAEITQGTCYKRQASGYAGSVLGASYVSLEAHACESRESPEWLISSNDGSVSVR